jgi:hypothetical protein
MKERSAKRSNEKTKSSEDLETTIKEDQERQGCRVPFFLSFILFRVSGREEEASNLFCQRAAKKDRLLSNVNF